MPQTKRYETGIKSGRSKKINKIEPLYYSRTQNSKSIKYISKGKKSHKFRVSKTQRSMTSSKQNFSRLSKSKYDTEVKGKHLKKAFISRTRHTVSPREKKVKSSVGRKRKYGKSSARLSTRITNRTNTYRSSRNLKTTPSYHLLSNDPYFASNMYN